MMLLVMHLHGHARTVPTWTVQGGQARRRARGVGVRTTQVLDEQGCCAATFTLVRGLLCLPSTRTAAPTTATAGNLPSQKPWR